MPRLVAANESQLIIHKLEQALPCCTKYCAVARKHVGTTNVPAAYSAGRYNGLAPHSRTSSTKSLS